MGTIPNQIFQEYDNILEREQNIAANAFQIKNEEYRKTFTAEEVAEFKDKFYEFSIKSHKKELEIKEKMALLKKDLEAIKTESVKYRDKIELGYETVEGTVYYMRDEDLQKMAVYDREGNLITVRALRPDERQNNLFRVAN